VEKAKQRPKQNVFTSYISIAIFAKNFIVGHAPWDFCSSAARAQHFQASSRFTTISQYISIIVVAELDFSFDLKENNHYVTDDLSCACVF
jgi:hypothetical protein